MSTLNTHHVVVIGGSSGIGLATARAAQQGGATVTVVGRRSDRLAAAAARLPDLRTAQADVLDLPALHAVFAEAGPVDHLVVTAGEAVLSDFVAGPDPAAQLDGFSVKVLGAANAIRAALPVLTPTASIVLTGGVSTARPVRGAWTTSVATAAVEQLARVLALELAPVRVNAVSPGWTVTPMWDTVLGEQAASVLEGARSQLPTARLAEADDVAAAVLALLSNPAITAEVLHVDGGGRLV